MVLLMLLVISLTFNAGSFLSGLAGVSTVQRRASGPRLDEVVKESGSREKIAVLSVEGIISSHLGGRGGFSLVDLVKAQLDRAAADEAVKAVILRVDSPGGEVLASDDIARLLTKFQDTAYKPVVVSMGSLAASGGYYISAPCSWIVANPLTITGSIGVIMHGYNYRGLMDKIGLRPEVYKSGKFKDMLSGDREATEITAEERAMVQKLIDETYGQFKAVVAEGRKSAAKTNAEARPLAEDWQEYADGRVLSGKEAYELGLVDELGDFDTAVARARKLGELTKKPTLVEYRLRLDFSDLFSIWGESEAKVVKVDLGVETSQLRPGCMYFLLPTYLR